MQCSKCGASVLPNDRFCEECGTLLIAGSCEKCGAGIEEIDEQGFCSNCGFRREPRERDWLEITIGSHLAGVSDRGLRHHHNEDFFALKQVNNAQTNILVVCDGVSSSDQSDLAAQTAAESACLTLATAWENPELAMKLAFNTALKSVSNIFYANNQNTDPPSTTIVAALVHHDTATIGWLGDSRAYWISPSGSRQLTKDDSWLTEVVAAGEMTEIEAKRSPNAHGITRWLGADADNADPSIVNFTIPGSGYLLLCTDGLWNYAPEALQLTNIIQQTSNTDVFALQPFGHPTAGVGAAIAISRSLVEFARNSGGHDNITVAVLCL
ncbi:PP2C family serine/threonine-protein phosphatase [Nostoc sp. UHCC 0302]